MYLYSPFTTRFFGGSNGTGVPFPVDTKLHAHRKYTMTPNSMGIKPKYRMLPISTANLSPEEESRRYGTSTKNTPSTRRVKIRVLKAIMLVRASLPDLRNPAKKIKLACYLLSMYVKYKL